jgi:hypothetical protein
VETEDQPCPYGANCNRGKPYNKDYLLSHIINNHLINLEQEAAASGVTKDASKKTLSLTAANSASSARK